MQFKSLLFPLLVLTSVHASTTAFSTWPGHGGAVAIGGRTLVARTTSGTNTRLTDGTQTATATRTNNDPASTAACNWCVFDLFNGVPDAECLTALAAEGVACAAAILEGGCNIIADISCIIDATAFGQAVPKCIACLH
ncbi:hypothetical protein C8R43DRAFT_1113342 [Mycena crocata]|nr:hypothetical protein C8R43DRAFT_1113342 [Mycena crocata]